MVGILMTQEMGDVLGMCGWGWSVLHPTSSSPYPPPLHVPPTLPHKSSLLFMILGNFCCSFTAGSAAAKGFAHA